MGHVTVVGGCRAKAPLTGILASTLSVGSTVKLIENGAAVEYLVVNQGIPENSSLYDTSCDGTWLLRKDVHSDRQWNTQYNTYENSLIWERSSELFQPPTLVLELFIWYSVFKQSTNWKVIPAVSPSVLVS